MPLPTKARLTSLLSALVASAVVALPAAAQTPLNNSAWTAFTFGDVGSSAFGQPYTYTSANPFYVTVLDGYLSGDQFDLYDGTTLIGSTTNVPTSGSTGCTLADLCLADPNYSRGTFQLGAGTYNFNIITTVSPYGGGGAWIGTNVSRTLAGTPAITSTPEPASLALVSGGLLFLGAAVRRRRA